MNYQPTLASILTEASVFLVFLLTSFNALGQGRRWFWTLIWGAVIGFAAEVLLVHQADPRYHYGLHFFFAKAWGVPICIGLGWGMVFYVSTWTAQRLAYKSVVVSSLVAGALGVSLDLSLDPVAGVMGFWEWHPLHGAAGEIPPDPNMTMFGVPFDNFVSWMGLIAVYGITVRLGFRALNRHFFGDDKGIAGGASMSTNAKGSRLWDAVLPLLAGLVAAVAFGLIRDQAINIYKVLGLLGGGQTGGEARAFAVLFLLGLGLSWYAILKGSRNEDVNYVALGVVAYFHALSFGLLLSKGLTNACGMMVVIPINFIASFVAFAWPCIDTLLEKFSTADSADFRMPRLIKRTLASYGGVKVRANVAAPGNVRELRALLAFATEAGKRVTFRAGGMAFDTQSLNDQIVISLHRFDTIQLDTANQRVTVGCGATWGEILKKTLPEGLAPYIMVTSSAATAGGTLSANSLTRFSPTCGREGRYVTRFQLLTPDGKLWECSNDAGSANYDLFLAVIGGLGYIGAVTEVTYRLLRLPDRNSVVTTEFTLVEGLERIANGTHQARFSKFVEHFVNATHEHCRGKVQGPPTALSAAVNMRGGAWGLIARSQYTAAQPLRRSIFHSPRSLPHLLLQVAATIPWLRRIGYILTHSAYKGSPKTYVDEPHGYTFFEDGNRRFRRALHVLGIPGRIRQQTFMIPYDLAAEQASTEQFASFMNEAERYLESQGLEPALIDVLYVGRDDHPFRLSSSNDFAGFAITFTFERLFREIDRESAALAEISKICENHGGRVHLVKNVLADQAMLRRMYAVSFQHMQDTRRPGAFGAVLSNEFSERVLKGI
jgi:decaprenylphospho-beta-D-ribofuranose 2-oxidase